MASVWKLNCHTPLGIPLVLCNCAVWPVPYFTEVSQRVQRFKNMVDVHIFMVCPYFLCMLTDYLILKHTEQAGMAVLCLGSTPFESCWNTCSPDWGFSWVSSDLPSKFQYTAPGYFHFLPSPFAIHYSPV
jgi:hypothetical protein